MTRRNYTASETRANWKFGIYLNEETQIAISQRFRHMQPIQQGATELDFTGDMFPSVSGVGGATILGERISFHYDTRNSLVTPTDGMAVTAYACKYQFEIVGRLKFTEGLVASIGKKRIEGNLDAAKRLMEAG